MKKQSEMKNMLEGLLAENLSTIGITGIMSTPSIFTQKDKEFETSEEEIDEKKNDEVFCVKVAGRIVWEGQAKDSKEALDKAKDELGEDDLKNAKVTKKSEINESEDAEEIKLSAKEFRTLYNCMIAEQMMNESLECMDELEQMGLLHENKMTSKSKELLKKYLPTNFSS